MRTSRTWGLLALLACVAWPGGGTAAAEIQVFAATSLSEALHEIAAAYEKSSGDALRLHLAASSTLVRQIEAGAPADLFFSADEAKLDTLDKRGLLLPDSRCTLLGNTLAIVVRRDSPLSLASAADLARPGVGRIALAEPHSVPAGIYAREYLQKIGLWAQVSDRIVPTEDVRAALAVVESGDVDAAIVYATDAAITSRVRVAYAVPAADGPPIAYAAAVLREARDPRAALRLLAHLQSEAARRVFARRGFRPVIPRPAAPAP